MATNLICELTSTFENLNPDEVVEMGDFFSGSIYYDDSRRSWVQFNLVNKEKMSYILNDINLNLGAHLEIQVYASETEKVQQ
tara:strand:- start:27 stop:272 length:246 start_codon:yes stop_codon:yes gene_type:complete